MDHNSLLFLLIGEQLSLAVRYNVASNMDKRLWSNVEERITVAGSAAFGATAAASVAFEITITMT